MKSVVLIFYLKGFSIPYWVQTGSDATPALLFGGYVGTVSSGVKRKEP
jgi:hypothetical protein